MARRDAPLIIEVAINGSTSKDVNPNVAVTPDEIAGEAVACLDAGAAIIHYHDASLATGTGGAVTTAAESRETHTRVLGARPDALCYPTTATLDGDIEQRWGHQVILGREGWLAMAYLDPGSLNFVRLAADGLPVGSDRPYVHTNAEIRWMLEQCRDLRMGPSMAIFDPSFLRMAIAIELAGAMPPGCFVKLYFGGSDGRNTYGMPPTAESLRCYLRMLEGSELPWAVAVPRGDCVASGLAQAAIEAGGHVRVGLEDYAGPRTPTNLELIAEVTDLAGQAGRPIAGSTEAAELLGLPRRPPLRTSRPAEASESSA